MQDTKGNRQAQQSLDDGQQKPQASQANFGRVDQEVSKAYVNDQNRGLLSGGTTIAAFASQVKPEWHVASQQLQAAE